MSTTRSKETELLVVQSYHDSGNLSRQEFYKIVNGIRLIHNDGGPAYQTWYENGRLEFQVFYIDGKIHRAGGQPASLYWDSCGYLVREIYYENDKLHNVNGPAEILNKETGTIKNYYLNGKEYSQLAYEQRKKELTEPTCDGKIVTIDGKQYRLESVE